MLDSPSSGRRSVVFVSKLDGDIDAARSGLGKGHPAEEPVRNNINNVAGTSEECNPDASNIDDLLVVVDQGVGFRVAGPSGDGL